MKAMRWVRLAVLLVVGVTLFTSTVSAAERLLIPEQLDLPFYVQGLGHTDDLAWVGAVFYRPLETAPCDIAVNDFVSVDPETYPLSVEGFAVVDEDDSYPPYPLNAVLRNRPGKAVEICFTSVEDYLKAVQDDGKSTIDELRAMPSLIVGYADFYLEVNQPPDPRAPGKGFSRDVIASGVLEDGTPFYVRSVYTNGAYNIDFRFGD
jgi:hypothetical protein